MRGKTIIIFISVFILSFVVHLIDLNAEGRTWDEQFKTDTGIAALKDISSGKFTYNDWAVGFEHPPLAKYLYGLSFLPELKTINPKSVSPDEYDYLLNGNYYAGMRDGLIKIQPYDFTIPRVVSAVLNAGTVSLTFLIAYLCFQHILPGIISAFILLSIPRFVAMGRLMTFESISGFLIALLFVFLLGRRKKSEGIVSFVIPGILLGALLWTRYNNISVFITYAGWTIIVELFKKQRNWKQVFLHIFFTFFIAGVLGFIVWPFLWIDFPRGIFATVTEHKTRIIVSSFYHVLSFLETTPAIYLGLLFVGVAAYIKNRTRNNVLFLWWFFSTAVFFILFSSPGGGTRYMFVIYPATALIAATGVTRLLSGTKAIGKTIALFCLAFYGIVTLSSIHPYYLDYYNAFVGGVKGAEEKKLETSWWGEGQRATGLWLQKNATQNAKVGLMVTPKYVFPRVRTDVSLLPYGEQIELADYVVVSKTDLVAFKKIKGTWKQVYTVDAENVPLVYVFQREK